MASPCHPLIGAWVCTHNGIPAMVVESENDSGSAADEVTPLVWAIIALSVCNGKPPGMWVRLRLQARSEDVPHHAVDKHLPAYLIGNKILYNSFAAMAKVYAASGAYVMEPRCIVRAARLPSIPEPFTSRVVPELVAGLIGKSHSRQGGVLIGSMWVEGIWTADEE